MTNILLDSQPSPEPVAADEPPLAVSPESGQDHVEAASRPEELPEKFWDPARNEVRIDALVKSYGSLERKLGGLTEAAGHDVPENPEGYDIETDSAMISSDPAVNARLHQAGFTQEQARLVYELAQEHMEPLVTEMAAEFAMRRQVDRLTEHFGGKDVWRQTSAQLASWGEANLPADTFKALASSYDGVIALHAMMAKGEPGVLREGQASKSALSEAALKNMMRDPRYWRDHEPGYVQQVKDGFDRLYEKTG